MPLITLLLTLQSRTLPPDYGCSLKAEIISFSSVHSAMTEDVCSGVSRTKPNGKDRDPDPEPPLLLREPPSLRSPPDGGYGWVVVVCGWFNLFTMAGTSCVFGLFYADFLNTFEAGEVQTVFIISIFWFCQFSICKDTFTL